MAKKLAITISGAVSLGCYEAGVLYEVITALDYHNRHARDEDKIEIDVLTGASAGGMTAAIAAQKLLFEAEALNEPYDNSLYRAWVKDVDLEGLLKLQALEDPTHALLSSNLVEDISKKHLTDRYASGIPLTRNKHAAAADTIHLGLALANLNGIDYQRDLQLLDQHFCYARYQDEMTRKLEADSGDDDSFLRWEILRNAAVSCGAFPFAFRVKDLVRHVDEYTNKPFFVPFSSATRHFVYTDGGTFQNEPLGLAKELVNMIDPDHTGTPDRFYLFVAPRARASTSNSQFQEKTADFGTTAKQMVSAIFNQARFHDWIRAETMNEKIQLFNLRAEQLYQALLRAGIQAQDLDNAATHLLNLLFSERDDDRLQAEARLKQQFASEYETLRNTLDLHAADVWIQAVLILETAANLGDKDEMQIFGITAGESELAGGKLEGFLGFFDRIYRDHDYDVGRGKAREFIDLLNRKAHPFGPINYPPEAQPAINKINHDLDNLDLKQVPIESRQRFKDRLVDRSYEVLKEIGVPEIGRDPIITFLVKPRLKQWLGL